MNKTITIFTLFLAMSVCVGCPSTESNAQAEKWKLEEPEVTPPKPSIVENGRVTFEPGVLPWADPEYRVVFHPISESDKNNGDRTLPVRFPSEEFKGDRVDEDTFYHRLGTLKWRNHFGRKPIYPDKVPLNISDSAPRYRGFYLPGDLDSNETPTLRLFEAPRLAHTNAVYTQDGLVFDWRLERSFNVHVPHTHPGHAWLSCQEKLYNYQATGASADSCGEATDIDTNYRAVFWFGDNPATDAHSGAFVFNTYSNSAARDSDVDPSSPDSLKELVFPLIRYHARNPETDPKQDGPRLYD